MSITMNILIAPDSFKGSLTAAEFCRIAAGQIQAIKPDAKLRLMPLADGGEGSIDAILSNVKGKITTITVHNALGKKINAQYAVLETMPVPVSSPPDTSKPSAAKIKQTAVIEMAQSCGLPHIAADKRDPMQASSHGTGELISDALDKGCRQLIIALGGSATNDGGSGMLQALGARFLDTEQQEIRACGESLINIHSIDLANFDSRLKDCDIVIAGDVINPLLGAQGATMTFGAQKGADKIMLCKLEQGMSHFARLTSSLLKNNYINSPGAGAAGGMGFALLAYCHARMKSGFEIIAEMADLDGIFKSTLSRPDIIITGEGRFDNQSLHGKLIGRLVKRADQYNIPVIVFCGQFDNALKMDKLSADMRIFSICHQSVSLHEAMNNTAELLEKLIKKSLQNVIKIKI